MYLTEITACFIISLFYNGSIIIIFIVLKEYAPYVCYIQIIQFLSSLVILIKNKKIAEQVKHSLKERRLLS